MQAPSKQPKATRGWFVRCLHNWLNNNGELVDAVVASGTERKAAVEEMVQRALAEAKNYADARERNDRALDIARSEFRRLCNEHTVKAVILQSGNDIDSEDELAGNYGDEHDQV